MSRTTIHFLVALLLGPAFFPGFVQAQECIGLPSGGRGLLTYGFEGTDGATGEGLSFGYQTPGAAVLLHRRSLEGFTLVDEIQSFEAQASIRLPVAQLPVCFVVGTGWTGYDNERLESRSSSGNDPHYVTERHRVGGPYHRFRVPVGVGLGREFVLGEGLSLTPFFAPALVYEIETYRPQNGSEQTRSRLGIAASGGLTAAVGWLVVRSTLTHTLTHEYALSSQHNFPMLSMHVGVRF